MSLKWGQFWGTYKKEDVTQMCSNISLKFDKLNYFNGHGLRGSENVCFCPTRVRCSSPTSFNWWKALFDRSSELFIGLNSFPTTFLSLNRLECTSILENLNICLIVKSLNHFVYFLLGTKEERGILKWKKHDPDDQHNTGSITLKTYDVPYVNKVFGNTRFFNYVPVCPTYNEELPRLKFLRRKEKREASSVPMSSRL